MKRYKLALSIGFFFSIISSLRAAGVTNDGGLSLLQVSGARASALGESFTAAQDDITAFSYNPASLSSLQTGQASFLFQQGIAEDSFGQLMIGMPRANGSLGLSIGHYNGGSVSLYDGVTTREVTAKSDLLIALGGSRKFGNFMVGITGKYLSSELAETAKAQAFAADFGVQVPVNSRIVVGASAQNIGTELKYLEAATELPRTVRTGSSILIFPGEYKTSLLLDFPYQLNEQAFHPSLGIETRTGILSLRAGYRKGSELEGFSLGTGFALGSASLDYAFGLVQSLNTRHQVSLSMKFGGVGQAISVVKQTPIPEQVEVVETPEPKKTTIADVSGDRQEKPRVEPQNVVAQVAEPEPAQVLPEQVNVRSSIVHSRPIKFKTAQRTKKQTIVSQGFSRRRVYVVSKGDTLEKIAQKLYGDTKYWTKIYDANEKIINNPKIVDLTGQKLQIP